jgi:hypothetical protein
VRAEQQSSVFIFYITKWGWPHRSKNHEINGGAQLAGVEKEYRIKQKAPSNQEGAL